MNRRNIERTARRLAAARGDIPSDLLITGGQVINVFDCFIESIAVAVFDGFIVGLGDYPARRTIDLDGAYLTPGFIEAHIHIESSKLTPLRFSEVVVPRGTTTVVADPHEIANVRGVEGIRYMLDCARRSPLDVFFMLPSCVPATDMETSGAALGADDLAPLLAEPDILGIGEVMNFPGAYSGDPNVLTKIALAGSNLPIDGHSPGLGGKNLAAYLAAGPSTDHECTTLDEAREKLKRGMRVMIREGSTAKNLTALIPLVTPLTERRMLFVSDDRRPGDLIAQGHLDYILRRAVGLGLDPVVAVRMVTLNAAETYRLHDRGAIRPGAVADLVALEDLSTFRVSRVWKLGAEIARDGGMVGESPSSEPFPHSGRLPVPPLSLGALAVPDRGGSVRVIEIIQNQIATKVATEILPVRDGFLCSDPARNIAKLAVIERHTGNGGMSVAFVKGLGIERGAIASTVAHDSHNIIVAGVDDKSMLTAVGHLTDIGGGQVAVEGGKVIAELALPVAGLMSERPAVEVADDERRLIDSARSLGCTSEDPFMVLSFLALPVIPELKLTDRGLVDVARFKIVSLYA